MIPAIAALATSFIQGASALAPTTPSPSVAPTSPSFEHTLGQVVSDAVGTIQNGEAAAIQGVNGDMPTFKVVEEVMNAQRTLQQAISVRDKAVSAYQEITRMAI
jgi:flagellar hook-basal body complex protein FliE